MVPRKNFRIKIVSSHCENVTKFIEMCSLQLFAIVHHRSPLLVQCKKFFTEIVLYEISKDILENDTIREKRKVSNDDISE